MANPEAIPLSQAAGDGPFLVDSVEDRDSQVLRLLRTSGIRPGIRMQVRSRSAAGHVKVRVGAKVIDLSPSSARAILVRS